MILVSDSGRIVVVDPLTGSQVLLADNETGKLGSPCGMDFDAQGNLVMANTQAVLQMDMRRDMLQVLAAGQSMRCPIGVAASRNGDLFVVDLFMAEIIRVDSQTGEQNLVVRGGLLNRPQAIAALGKDLYVTDVATADGNFGIGRVIHIDAATGEESVVSEGGLLVGPVGISADLDGGLIVSDPYTINEESADLFDGGIIRINISTGEQTLMARGEGGFVNPRGIAIVPKMSNREVNESKR